MNSAMSRLGFGTMLAAAVAAFATAAAAADYFWDNGGADGKWATGDNWNSVETDNVPPQDNDTAHLGSTSTSPLHTLAATGVVDQAGAVAYQVIAGYNTGAKGTLVIAGGSLDVKNWIKVSYSGLGRLVLSNGTLRATNSIAVGTLANKPGGTIEMEGGYMQTAILYLGQLAPGTMTQNGGTNRATTRAYISSANTAPATYELNDGLFNPTALDVGFSGTGNVVVAGGSLDVNDTISVGVNGLGRLVLSNGTLLVTNSSIAVGTQLDKPGGTLELEGGYMQTKYLYVGQLAPATVTQNGGTNRVTIRAYVGNTNTSPATYELGGGLFNPLLLEIGVSGTGTVVQTGGVLENLGQTTLGAKSGSLGNYRLENGTLNSLSLYVGNYGHGVFTQTGGTNTVGTFFVLPRYNTGVYNLWGGVMLIGTNGGGSASYVAAGFDGVEGTFNFGTTNSSGVIRQAPGSSGSYFTVGFREAVKGRVRGWGVCELTGFLKNNGIVVADGYGTDRDLDFSAMSSLGANDFANTATNGWYARDHGRLLLPAITAGNPVYWGDVGTQDLVNSVKLELTGSGSVTGALLAVDHALVNPGLHKPVGVWEFSCGAGVTGGKLTFLFDAAQLAAMNVDESRLRVWRHSGATWVDVTDAGGLDAGANTIRTATGNPFGQFAVAPVVLGTMIRIH